MLFVDFCLTLQYSTNTQAYSCVGSFAATRTDDTFAREALHKFCTYLYSKSTFIVHQTMIDVLPTRSDIIPK